VDPRRYLLLFCERSETAPHFLWQYCAH